MAEAYNNSIAPKWIPRTATCCHATNNEASKSGGTDSTHDTIYITCVILGTLVILENFLVCLAFACHRKLRKRSANVLVCSQACADLFNGLIFIPVELAERYNRRRILTPYLIAYLLFVSLFNLFSLALDRYLALIKPLMHHLTMDVTRTKRLLLIIWLGPLFITLLPLTWASSSSNVQMISSRVYVSIFWLLMFGLCAVMIAMYVMIYKTAAKTIRQRHKRLAMLNKEPENKISVIRKELRVAHLFGLLLFFFILAYLPILYLNLMDILKQYELISPVVEYISLYSLIINSNVNPILCLLLKKDYQMIIKRWICFDCIVERLRDESMQSQTSMKTDMENTEGNDGGHRLAKKRRFRKMSLTAESNGNWRKCNRSVSGSVSRHIRGKERACKSASDEGTTEKSTSLMSDGEKTQNGWGKTQNSGQKTQNSGQKTQSGWDKKKNGGQKTQNGWEKTQYHGQKTQNGWEKTQDGNNEETAANSPCLTAGRVVLSERNCLFIREEVAIMNNKEDMSESGSMFIKVDTDYDNEANNLGEGIVLETKPILG